MAKLIQFPKPKLKPRWLGVEHVIENLKELHPNLSPNLIAKIETLAKESITQAFGAGFGLGRFEASGSFALKKSRSNVITAVQAFAFQSKPRYDWVCHGTKNNRWAKDALRQAGVS